VTIKPDSCVERPGRGVDSARGPASTKPVRHANPWTRLAGIRRRTSELSYVRGRTLIQTSPAIFPPARSECRRQHPAVGKVMRTAHPSVPVGSIALGSMRGNRPHAPTGPSGASAYTLNAALPVMWYWNVVSRAARISCGAPTRILVVSRVDPTKASSASRPEV
jgi:hypothetical protein